MKKIIIAAVFLLIISCSRNDDTNDKTAVFNVNCITNYSNGLPTSAASSIDLQILNSEKSADIDVAMQDVIVQLDHNGVCVKSNADGYVAFSAISNGQHDIHIFSPNGYQWHSIYNFDTSNFQKIYLKQLITTATTNHKQKSYIAVKGIVANVLNDNRYDVFFINDAGEKYKSKITDTALNNNSQYTVNFELPVAVGTNVAGRLSAHKYQNNPLSNESYLLDITTITNSKLYTTTLKPGNYLNDIDISFPATTAKIDPILSINAIIVPEQLRITSLNIRGEIDKNTLNQQKPDIVFYKFSSNNNNLSLPKVFSSADPFNFQDISLSVRASQTDNSDTFWSFTQKYPKNTAVQTITARLQNLPRLLENRIGRTIVWDRLPPNLNSQTLKINYHRDQITTTAWNLILDPTVKSATLPSIPQGVISILNLWTQFELSLTGVIGTEVNEHYAVTTKTWQLKPTKQF